MIIEIDDEDYDTLHEIIEKHAPDLHGCAATQLRREIVEIWLPKVMQRAEALLEPSRAVCDVLAERRVQDEIRGLRSTTPRRDLVKAAALIFVEIERLDRAEAKEDAHD